METVNCFEIDTFSKVANIVQNKGTAVLLDDKLVTQKNTKAIELIFDTFLLERIENENDIQLLIIDRNKQIPTFTVSKVAKIIKLSAHASRFDTEAEIEQRKEIWCQIATNILAK